MNNKNIYIILAALITLVSCTKDLDRLPTNETTADQVYSTAQGYKQAFAKVYGSMALTGNNGPAGNGDIQGIDEGTSDFLRLFWKAQTLSTDEAVVGWGDAGIQDFHNMNWSADNPFIVGLYYRCFYQITLANDFISQSAPEKVSARGISGADANEIALFREEARFLRAYQYWVLMDLFGNPPFITDETPIGSVIPPQISRADLFNYIESELKDLETKLAPPRSNEYGRADQAAVWALLARMYLNAQVYIGSARYNDAITYAKKVIDAGYSLIPDYSHLFLADNHLNTDEFIWTINYDGLRTQNWGGMTFIIHAAVVDNMDPLQFGIPSGGWFGLRTTKNLPNIFPDHNGDADKRAMFQQNKLEIDDIGKSGDGYGVTKFKNVTRSGAIAPNIDPDGNFVDTDFPVFRLAEMYLIYAEAVLRGGTNGDMGTAVNYINLLRQRAYKSNDGNVATINLDFILDERARELYWEGQRRTDLIRYGRFTQGTYLWPWKGGVKDGRGVESFRNLYPIPSADITSNPNLKQNPGY